MTTEQSYVGKANYAPTPTEPAQNQAQTLSTPDDRQQAIDQAQSELLTLVDDFVNTGYASGPVQAISELLYHWLTTPATDLRITADQQNLHQILKLIQFLTELYEHQVSLDKVMRKKEVTRGN